MTVSAFTIQYTGNSIYIEGADGLRARVDASSTWPTVAFTRVNRWGQRVRALPSQTLPSALDAVAVGAQWAQGGRPDGLESYRACADAQRARTAARLA